MHTPLAMAARRLLSTHDPTHRSPRPAPAPPPAQREVSFPMLLPVFILFVLLLCFLSIFLLRDLLRFFSLWIRRRRRLQSRNAGAGGDNDDATEPPLPRKPAGLDPAVLASFPTVRFEAAAVAAECAVCLSDFAHGDSVRLLTVCRHAFHAACIDSWLDAHTTCPVCRSDLDVHAHAHAPPVEELAVNTATAASEERGSSIDRAAAAAHEATERRTTTSRPASDHR